MCRARRPAKAVNPMKTKTFDAVAESRKWREATSRRLDAMPLTERLVYLAGVRERFVQRQQESRAWSADEIGVHDSCVLREEPPKK